MRIGRPIPELVIAAEQRTALQNWARRPKSAQALALRAKKIILACSEWKVQHRSERATFGSPNKWSGSGVHALWKMA